MSATLAVFACFATGGLLLGLAYFGLLWVSVREVARGNSPTRALGLAVLRLALAGAVLAYAAQDGALPLIAVGLGLLVGRAIAMRRLAGSPP